MRLPNVQSALLSVEIRGLTQNCAKSVMVPVGVYQPKYEKKIVGKEQIMKRI